MKKILIILFIFNSAFLSAQISKLNTFDLEKKMSSNSELLKTDNFFNHQSVSLGGGFVILDTRSIFSVFSISTSVHFSKTP